MVGELFTLPLRVGVRATQLWLRATGEAVGLAVQLAGRALDLARERGEGGVAPVTPASPAVAPTRPPVVSDGAPGSVPTGNGRAQAEEARPGPTMDQPVDVAEEAPAHVSEEPELVDEFSEPGAEEGAGAEVHVQEPWDGYERANAKEVIARLQSATPAELAAVQLYERGHRGRQTVLAAVEREIRTATGGGSPTSERNR